MKYRVIKNFILLKLRLCSCMSRIYTCQVHHFIFEHKTTSSRAFKKKTLFELNKINPKLAIHNQGLHSTWTVHNTLDKFKRLLKIQGVCMAQIMCAYVQTRKLIVFYLGRNSPCLLRASKGAPPCFKPTPGKRM